jgi:hypothetical protein
MTSLKISTIALAALAVLLGAAVADAASPCIKDAKREHKDCRATCKEDFQIAKDACLNRDHACVEVCRAQRSECREATGFDAAIDACNAQLAIDKQACKDAHPADTPERDQCIDQVQVIAFQCRDAAREVAKPLLRACRRTFRACARACAPAEPPIPSSEVRQCKVDAAAAHLACKAECREDFQVAKDACRNRDHACVELCRADRAACKQPFLDQLAAALAGCKATRDAGVLNCQNLFAEGTPERDQCIDNVQVEAFQCRDQAREDVRPGLHDCRVAFRACVGACPPPPPPAP